MHKNDNTLIIALLAFALGFACCDICKSKQKNNKIQKPQSEINVLKDNAPEIVNYEDIDKMFYTSLQNCEPINVLAKPGHIGYVIEGIIDNKCVFKERQVGFMDTICSLPMDMTEKYAEEGLNISKQIDELRAQNKSGFVDASQYINDINNDKNYCKHEYYQRKK